MTSVQLLADRLLNEHELFKKGWRFSFDRAKRRAGCCRYSKEITLAKAYAEQEEFKEIKNTILHEVTRGLVQNMVTTKFGSKALEIGCDAGPAICCFSKPKYKLTCSNSCFEVTRYRVNQIFEIENLFQM